VGGGTAVSGPLSARSTGLRPLAIRISFNITDFGIVKSARGDMPYLVMEFLDGQTLSDFQKAKPLLPLPMIDDFLDQIGLALAEAHRHGIIHRDLKLHNIWLEPNGREG
jgi:serine/threonine protein kinase